MTGTIRTPECTKNSSACSQSAILDIRQTEPQALKKTPPPDQRHNRTKISRVRIGGWVLRALRSANSHSLSELHCASLMSTVCHFLVLLCCRYVTCMTWSLCNGIVRVMEANVWLEVMQSVVSTVPSVYGSNEVKVITLHAFLSIFCEFICWLISPFMRRSHGLFQRVILHEWCICYALATDLRDRPIALRYRPTALRIRRIRR